MKTALVGLVIASASLLGCASAPPQAASAPQTVPVVNQHDQQLVSEVRDQLAQQVGPETVSVTAAQGKIALRGTVADADEARRAVKSALAVEGVRGVVNDLKVGEPTGAVSARD